MLGLAAKFTAAAVLAASLATWGQQPQPQPTSTPQPASTPQPTSPPQPAPMPRAIFGRQSTHMPNVTYLDMYSLSSGRSKVVLGVEEKAAGSVVAEYEATFFDSDATNTDLATKFPGVTNPIVADWSVTSGDLDADGEFSRIWHVVSSNNVSIGVEGTHIYFQILAKPPAGCTAKEIVHLFAGARKHTLTVVDRKDPSQFATIDRPGTITFTECGGKRTFEVKYDDDPSSAALVNTFDALAAQVKAERTAREASLLTR